MDYIIQFIKLRIYDLFCLFLNHQILPSDILLDIWIEIMHSRLMKYYIIRSREQLLQVLFDQKSHL
jgi:hypothetical protein